MSLRDELLAYAEANRAEAGSMFAWWVADLKSANEYRLAMWRDRLRQYGRLA